MSTGSWIGRVAAATLLAAVLITLSVLYVDRPVESFVANNISTHFSRLMFFRLLASPSLLPEPVAITYLIVYALYYLSRRTAWLRAQLFLKLSAAVLVAMPIKDALKWVIGRPWPATWVQTGIYNLHPFTHDGMFGCFPSGHTTLSAAPTFVLWWCVPKYRPLWLAIVVSVMIGLVFSGYHFVGDVTAGFFLGLAVGTATVAAWPILEQKRKQFFF